MRISPLVMMAAALLVPGLAGAPRADEAKNGKPPASIHDFKVKTIDGELFDLKKLRGKVLMVINVASR